MLSRCNNFKSRRWQKKRADFLPPMYIRAALAKSSITAENFLDPQAALSRFFFRDLLRDGFQFAEAVGLTPDLLKGGSSISPSSFRLA